jgi:hypothetical protein
MDSSTANVLDSMSDWDLEILVFRPLIIDLVEDTGLHLKYMGTCLLARYKRDTINKID